MMMTTAGMVAGAPDNLATKARLRRPRRSPQQACWQQARMRRLRTSPPQQAWWLAMVMTTQAGMVAGAPNNLASEALQAEPGVRGPRHGMVLRNPRMSQQLPCWQQAREWRPRMSRPRMSPPQQAWWLAMVMTTQAGMGAGAIGVAMTTTAGVAGAPMTIAGKAIGASIAAGKELGVGDEVF